MTTPNKCKECGSKRLTWSASVENTGGCEDGRIRLHEVSGIFTLGCDECSETVAVVNADDIANFINNIKNVVEKVGSE